MVDPRIVGWCTSCGIRRAQGEVCSACEERALRLGRPLGPRGPAGPAVVCAPPPPAARARSGIRSAIRGLELVLVLAIGAAGFNRAFPTLVAGQRPTVVVIPPGSGAGPQGGAALGDVPPWDQVDVDLFTTACTQNMPPTVCQCEVNGLQGYYSGEDALIYANKITGKAALPQAYHDVVVRCSESY